MSRTNLGGDHIDRDSMTATLRASADTNVGRCAGAIWKYTQEGYRVTVTAVGAGALNQAIKAVISARKMAAGAGKDFYLIPAWDHQDVGGRQVSVLQLFLMVHSVNDVRARPLKAAVDE